MKKTLIALLMLPALAACGADPEVDTNVGGISERKVELNDGRSVTCLTIDGHKRGGISCDWAKASR